MQISICKLTYELLDDWLSYFDKDAFSDNDEWCGCYCMCYHWDSELEKKRAWDCDEDCVEFNREQAIEFIKNGRMQGYLAYVQGKVVGWCNSNNKKRTIMSILILQKKFLITVKKSNLSFVFLLHLNIGDVALPLPCLNMYVRMRNPRALIR